MRLAVHFPVAVEPRTTSTLAAGEPPDLQAVDVEMEDEIATIRLDRSETLNAIDAQLASDLRSAVEWCAAIESLRCVIVTGAGKGFSAGGHLPALQRGAASPGELESTVGYLADELGRTVRALRRLPCPVIAALNGRAAGGGLSLALACDLRIASERAVLDFAYARIGATPDGGMTWFLPRLVGLSRATELLLESPIVRPARGLELGLVCAVVAPAELDPSARTLARRLTRRPRHYAGAVKRLVREGAEAELAPHLERERASLLESLGTEDARSLLAELGGPAGSPGGGAGG